MNIETALKEAMTTEGALGVALVDWESGMTLGTLGGGKYLDLDVAAAGPWPEDLPLRPGRDPHGPADQWMAKSARVYPSALTVGWMKLFSIIRVACASAALISGPVTFGLCLT